MTDKAKEMAPQIWEAIQKSNNVLLHFHPSPDPDTVGSSMAMMHLISGLGKNVTVISGDSNIPNWLKALPGTNKVLQKNYREINPKDFDLFIIMDSSNMDMISKKTEVKFPENMTTVVIDHHISNSGFGKINLVDDHYVATCHLIYDLMKEWGVELTPEIAACLFLGIYSDSGGFQYPPTGPDTFLAAAELVKIYPNFTDLVFEFGNNNDPGRIKFEGLALSSVEHYFGDKLAISCIPFEAFEKNGLYITDSERSNIPNFLKSVIGWDLGISFIEKEPGKIKLSFRTRDDQKYDLSKIAMALGGGGHKGAAGASIDKPFDEAKKYLLEKLAETYPDLGNP